MDRPQPPRLLGVNPRRMPRRRSTEAEKEHEYREHQRVERGERIVGDEAESLDEAGAVGEVRARREEEAP